jgi:hypothetical protein
MFMQVLTLPINHEHDHSPAHNSEHTLNSLNTPQSEHMLNLLKPSGKFTYHQV